MKLMIKYWASEDDYKAGRATIATIPVSGIGDAIQVVRNWYWKIQEWNIQL